MTDSITHIPTDKPSKPVSTEINDILMASNDYATALINFQYQMEIKTKALARLGEGGISDLELKIIHRDIKNADEQIAVETVRVNRNAKSYEHALDKYVLRTLTSVQPVIEKMINEHVAAAITEYDKKQKG